MYLKSFISKILVGLLLTMFPLFAQCEVGTTVVQNLISPPETETSSSITLLWNKPVEYKSVVGYDIYVNGKLDGFSKKTNYTINGLKPNRNYSVSIVSKDINGKKSENCKPITVKTKYWQTLVC